jgi:two-component system, OmpR family, sensor kinase
VPHDEFYRSTQDVQAALTAAEQRLESMALELAHEHGAVIAGEELFTAAGHELRNPVSTMVLLTESIEQGIKRLKQQADPKTIDWLEARVGLLLRQMRDFVRRTTILLDVSQLSSGRLRLEPARVDVAAVARLALDAIEPLARSNGVEISTRLESVDGYWDPVRLEQVIENLLTNAVKFGRGRPVEVTLTRRADLAIIDVKDQGVGIGPADRERIFGRFERGEGQERSPGFGIGLWMVKQLVEAMGGGITLTSSPGVGSTFTVLLPIEPQRERAEGEGGEPESKGGDGDPAR